ncbi:MAG: hypothetical protein RLZZ561_1050 [Pseudomonadota bacterium]|jgi:hypothetical protein
MPWHRHIILTRFNVPTKGREADIRAKTGWLERRFDLFERFCLPSVAGQTRRDFSWIIYFDAMTPAPFRARIARAQQCFPFTALFRDALPLEDVRADVSAQLPNGKGRVLTTRLDNDDALARDFVARVQDAGAMHPTGTALNFPNGFSWRKGWVYAARDQSSPFASVVEDAVEFQTIWARPHAVLGEAFRLIQIEDGPAWLQVIHGDNVTNRIKGRQRPGSVLGDRFTIEPGANMPLPGPFAVLAETLIHYPLRHMREGAIRGVKPFLKIVR